MLLPMTVKLIRVRSSLLLLFLFNSVGVLSITDAGDSDIIAKTEA